MALLLWTSLLSIAGCRRDPGSPRNTPETVLAPSDHEAGSVASPDLPSAVAWTPRLGQSSPSTGSPKPETLLEHERGNRQPAVADLASWMRDHDVKVGRVHPPCWEIEAGVPLREGLICHRLGKERLTATIHVVMGNRLATAWEGIVFTYENWLYTTLTIENEGRELAVADPPDRDCHRAVMALEQKIYPGLGADVLLKNLATGCRQRGTYVWSGKSYVRAK
jgi:hypothetical protein